MNTIARNRLNSTFCEKCSILHFNNKDGMNFNCLAVKDEYDEINEIQIKKEEEKEEMEENKNIDSKAKREEAVEHLEISRTFKKDETEEETSEEEDIFVKASKIKWEGEIDEITEEEINDENHKYDIKIIKEEIEFNKEEERTSEEEENIFVKASKIKWEGEIDEITEEEINDENHEYEVKMIKEKIETNKKEEKKDGVLHGKNNVSKFLEKNNNDVLNDMSDEEELITNCPHCNTELPYHGEGVTICLETCRHILCRYCISDLLHKLINNEINELRCPYIQVTQCNTLIDEAEYNIENLVHPDLYKRYLMSLAEKLKDDIKSTVFCCKTFKCEGWCVIEGDNVENFLCPICKKNNSVNLKINENEKKILEDMNEYTYVQNERYNELMLLMENDSIPNFESFECPICLVSYNPYEGLILKNCLHTFCKQCIANTVLYSDDADVKCPYKDENYSCDGTIQQCEVKALLKSDDYKRYLQRSIKKAESEAGNSAYHCKTPDCPGWCIHESDVESFICPVCEKTNCLLCKKIHKISCTDDLLPEISDSMKSDFLIQQMLETNNALPCPTCNAVITKVDGCDAVICIICKTEICWLTRGPRWGPRGRGDTSGGCKCTLMAKCHPLCRYCH